MTRDRHDPDPNAEADFLTAALARLLAEEVGGEDVVVERLHRVSGGASRETWSFDARHSDDRLEPLILRRDPPGAVVAAMSREARLLNAAREADVPVPRVVSASDDPERLGSAFLLMERVEGETIPRRILRDEQFAECRLRLARQCGEILARVHRMPIDVVPGLERDDQLDRYRALADHLGEPHPAFELGFRWLESHRPCSQATSIVHGDFRNGNFIVGPDGIRAVLDWELAHIGDPLEDLGWLCVKSWRFGSPLEVGGFGTYEELASAYEEASGRAVNLSELRWWEAFGTLRWGILCIFQTLTHRSGAVRSVELAAIGRRVCEVEWDLLPLLADGSFASRAERRSDREAEANAANAAGSLHDIPSAGELLEAVREFLESDVMDNTEGRVHFHARVAANVVGVVERELSLGPELARAHRERLGALGVASDWELADRIRSGELDEKADEVMQAVRDSVRAKLEVANPRYLEPFLNTER